MINSTEIIKAIKDLAKQSKVEEKDFAEFMSNILVDAALMAIIEGIYTKGKEDGKKEAIDKFLIDKAN